jgi:hydrogenase maturation protease
MRFSPDDGPWVDCHAGSGATSPAWHSACRLCGEELRRPRIPPASMSPRPGGGAGEVGAPSCGGHGRAGRDTPETGHSRMSRGVDTIVIGLGNPILGDGGLGVHAVRRLRQRYATPAAVELIEGDLARPLMRHLVGARGAILVAAIDAGATLGELVRLDGRDWASACSIRMTPHESALEELIGAARTSGAWPDRVVLFGAQPASIALGNELSPPVAAALDRLVDAIAAELAAWNLRSPAPPPPLAAPEPARASRSRPPASETAGEFGWRRGRWGVASPDSGHHARA